MNKRDVIEESELSSAVAAILLSPPPTPPTDLTVVKIDSRSITLSWANPNSKNIDGYTYGYRVYRSLTSSGDYSSVGESSTTSYTDTSVSAATTYYYKVSSYAEFLGFASISIESPQSSYVSATTPAPSFSGTYEYRAGNLANSYTFSNGTWSFTGVGVSISSGTYQLYGGTVTLNTGRTFTIIDSQSIVSGVDPSYLQKLTPYVVMS